eukprot:2000749-Lingulodinium_polyedra.AAC.1
MTLRSCVLSTLRATPTQVRMLRGTTTRSATRWGTTTDAWQARAGHNHRNVSDHTNDRLSINGRGSPNVPARERLNMVNNVSTMFTDMAFPSI